MHSFKSKESEFILGIDPSETATGFFIMDNSGHMTESCPLYLRELKHLRAIIELEIERLTD